MNPKYDFLYKILLIGDSGSHKTHIIEIIASDNDPFISTIGIDFRIRNDVIGDKKIKSQIWDTAGQERFHTITTSYYRGIHGIFLVFSVACRKAFQNLDKWLEQMRSYINDDVVVMILANECEEVERQVSQEEIADFALGQNIPYMEVSSLHRRNVTEAFDELLKAVHEKNMMAQEKIEQKPDEPDSTEKTDSKNRCDLL